MGRSQKWPDLRSPISKIQDIRFVGTDDLIIFRKFHNFPWNIVAVARWESYCVVGSLDLTWWPDLTWPWAEIFTKVAEMMGGKVGENPAALRAAVFSLSSKNLRGGRSNAPPPAGRGLRPRDLTHPFSNFQWHSIPLNVFYIYEKTEIHNRGSIRGKTKYKFQIIFIPTTTAWLWTNFNLDTTSHNW